MAMLAVSLLVAVSAVGAISAPPSPDQKAQYARWMVSSMNWGFLSTISTRKEATSVGAPFGNPYSFSDVQGVPYFYASDLDASMIDLFTATSPKANPRATFVLSGATLMLPNGTAALAGCRIGTTLGDPENPQCGRLVVSGVMTKVAPNSTENATATAALFERHPSFRHYPSGHSFYVAKMTIDGLWLIDQFGGAAIIEPSEYFAATSVEAVEKPRQMVRPTLQTPPSWEKKPETARWMVQALTWGALSTLSTRSDGSTVGDAFGNPYSFADVAGVPYFYASGLDASMIDLFTGENASTRASFTLSEATENTQGVVHNQACTIGTFLGDPENPQCARLQLSGTVSKLITNSTEEKTAKAALFARHPSFKNYPAGHAFYVAKLTIEGVWLIDMFGGAAIISPADYFKANPSLEVVV